MTDEELSELRRCAERCVTHYEGCDCRQLAHVEEVARLRAENAALREHGQEVSRLTAELSGAAIERRDQEIARLRTENAEQTAIINELTPALLALKDENAALREMAQAVATMPVCSGNEYGGPHCHACGGSGPIRGADTSVEHMPDCPVTRARALLEANS